MQKAVSAWARPLLPRMPWASVLKPSITSLSGNAGVHGAARQRQEG